MQETLILVVDDQPDSLDTIVTLLAGEQHNPYKLLKAPDGKKGCKLAEKHLPDLIILDWEMPVVSGHDAIRYLKETPKTADIPIIVATGLTSSESLEKSLADGAIDYIRKPVDKTELLARVRLALQLSRSYKELQEQREKLRLKNEELKNLNKEKDNLMGIVAHDLKSPLNKVQGLIQLLPMVGQLNDEQAEYIEMVKKAIQSGRNLIRDLLDISAHDHHGSKMDIGTFSLYSLMKGFLETYSLDAGKKSIALEFNFSGDDVEIVTDVNFLTRIIDNILSNAIKFSDAGKTVTVESGSGNGRFYVSVKDQGPGFTQEDKEKMFRRFQKLSAKPTGGEGSTGLGLSIIKALADRLGGTIEVESEPGKGAVFKVEFPLVLGQEQG